MHGCLGISTPQMSWGEPLREDFLNFTSSIIHAAFHIGITSEPAIYIYETSADIPKWMMAHNDICAYVL